jgi:hypothetical protein
MRLITYLTWLFFITFFLAFAAVVEAAGKAVGRVVWVKGSFSAVGPEGTRSLERAGIFYEKDTLVTGAGSEAQVVFSDNSLMTFSGDTHFRVDQYSLKSSGGGSYVMTLAEGGLRTVTGTIASKEPDNYKIKTPVATIGVRGTEFIAYYKNGRLYVGRIKGKPCVFDNIKRIQICLTPQMPYVIVLAGEGSTVSSDMPRELNDEDSLVIVPAMIQPNPPGGGINGGGQGGQVNSFCVT